MSMYADTTSASDGVSPPPAPAPAPEPVPVPMWRLWTRQQDKLLEMLLCRLYPRWDRIAALLGDTTPAQVCQRYECVVAELRRVLEAPGVETPPEWDWDLQEAAAAPAGGEAPAGAAAVGEDAGAPASTTGGEILEERGKKRKRGGKRSKSVNWTTEEHRLFLEGLEKHGKGRWKTLAREFVKTRSPTQIASHFQKFAIRQQKIELQQCKRASIHDINDPNIIPAAVADHPSVAADDHDDEPAAEDELVLTTIDESAGEDDELVTIDEYAGEDGLGILVK